MTTAVFERAGRVAEQVQKESRELDPVKVLLTLLMVPFFLVGWTASKACKVAWVAFAWTWTATVVGWRTARGEDST